jgi:hypothetical protein
MGIISGLSANRKFLRSGSDSVPQSGITFGLPVIRPEPTAVRDRSMLGNLQNQVPSPFGQNLQ